MPSPFPGMDPYLEHPGIWPEVHHRLAVNLADLLQPLIRPKYLARLERRVYEEPISPDTLTGIGDVSVVREPSVAPYMAGPHTVQVRLPRWAEVREPYLLIRSQDTHTVVTVIEILSPSNKASGPGRQHYLGKRTELLDSSANLVEIDLLRRGARMPVVGAPEGYHYSVFVHRSGEDSASLTGWTVRSPLPDIRVPLSRGDADVTISLSDALATAYERGSFDWEVDYARPAEPPLTGDDAAWADDLLKAKGLRPQ